MEERQSLLATDEDRDKVITGRVLVSVLSEGGVVAWG